MTQLIQLTQKGTHTETMPIFINPAHIVAVERDNDRTCIKFNFSVNSNAFVVLVMETPEQIIKLCQ